MDNKLLKDLLKEQMQAKGLTLERIRQQTGIAERHLSSLLEGRYQRLPAAPYVRGYLIRIASVLDLNGQELWGLYKDELAIKRSGPADRLPENRFALQKIGKRWLFLALALVLILVYGGLNINRFLGRPEIMITSPSVETLVTTANVINLLGKTDPANKLMISGEEIAIDQSGNFQKAYSLEPGLNRIEFTVKRILGKEFKVVRQVIYQPQIGE